MIFWPEEREIWTKPPITSSEEWGMENYSLSVLSSASAGPWSLAKIPVMRIVLKYLDKDGVEIVTIQKATQIAGTETIIVNRLKRMDQQPGPGMFVLADQGTAEEVCVTRIQQAMRSSQTLSGKIIEAKFTKKKITLKNNASITMGWASSIATTASRPERDLTLDEICKPGYGSIGVEGSGINRIIQRTETFPNRSIVMLSTVTVEGDNMDIQRGLAELCVEPYLPCPHCGMFQPLRFFPEKYMDRGEEKVSGQVVFEKGETIRERAATARYQCGGCGELWTTAQKNHASTLCIEGYDREPTGDERRVHITISRLVSLFPGGRLESLVQAFLESKDDPEALQSFYNNSLAKHWEERVSKEASEEKKEWLKCWTDLPGGIVPDCCVAIIAAVDVQKHGFWYRLRAFTRDTTSWGIVQGHCESWEALEQILFHNRYKSVDGRRSFHCWRIMIDTGGGKAEDADISRTEETYHWIRRNHGRNGSVIYGCKGSSWAMPTKIKKGNPIDKTPSGVSLPGGLTLIQVNTKMMKDSLLFRRSQAAEGAEGAIYVNRDTPEEWADHMTAEEKRRDRKTRAVVWVQTKRDNHYLDCEVLCQVGADSELDGGVAFLHPPKKPSPKPEPEEEYPATPQPLKQKRQRQKKQNPWTKGTRRR